MMLVFLDFFILLTVFVKELFTLRVRRLDLSLRMEVTFFTSDTKHYLQLTKIL